MGDISDCLEIAARSALDERYGEPEIVGVIAHGALPVSWQPWNVWEEFVGECRQIRDIVGAFDHPRIDALNHRRGRLR